MRLITFLAFSVGLAVAAPAGMNSPPKDAAKREWLDGYGGGGGGGYGGGGGGGYGGGGRGGYGLDDDDDDGSDVVCYRLINIVLSSLY